MTDAHFRNLERMFYRAPINEGDDADLTVRDGEATLVLPVDEGQFHPLRAVHGSVYFKVLDDAAFFAANSLVEDVFLLTTDFNTYLERPVSEGELRAEGEVLNDNPEQLIAGSVAYDAEGREIARGTGTFRRSDLPLGEAAGYEA
jgi:uncharacterized protein (TIGR00369 family)